MYKDKSRQRRKSRRGVLAAASAVLLAVIAAGAGYWFLKSHTALSSTASQARDTTAQAVPKIPAAQPVKDAVLTSRLLFMGDVYWGRRTNQLAQASPLKEKYPFQNLHEFGRDKYDGWIANLECPSVPGVDQPYQTEVSKLLFNCPSSYMPEAAKWFTAVSQANNHAGNQNGQTGVDATRKVLDENGIQHFGNYDPTILKDICEVVAVGARVSSDGGKEHTAQLPIAMCGYHGLSVLPSDQALSVMQGYAKYMPVFAYPHMGVEYTAAPTAAQQTLYRKMIDNGADAVFGGHPHWIQTSEVYKKKLIVYSMGDFLFDQGPGETQRGAAIDLTLTVKASGAADNQNLQAWLKLADSCKAFQDDCLAKIQAQRLTKLNFSYRYDIVGVSATKTPGPASAEEDKLINDRLKWDTVGPEINAD